MASVPTWTSEQKVRCLPANLARASMFDFADGACTIPLAAGGDDAELGVREDRSVRKLGARPAFAHRLLGTTCGAGLPVNPDASLRAFAAPFPLDEFVELTGTHGAALGPAYWRATDGARIPVPNLLVDPQARIAFEIKADGTTTPFESLSPRRYLPAEVHFVDTRCAAVALWPTRGAFDEFLLSFRRRAVPALAVARTNDRMRCAPMPAAPALSDTGELIDPPEIVTRPTTLGGARLQLTTLVERGPLEWVHVPTMPTMPEGAEPVGVLSDRGEPCTIRLFSDGVLRCAPTAAPSVEVDSLVRIELRVE